ncbi:MAG TPA: BatA domain-containing protein [Blastocatellia bacterium]|nr:BatA domain-containing protein [Blastocatellia bacterium]
MSFLNPLFLFGLAAVAVPVIVHLVRRTRAPRVEFPSLMFVRRIPQRTIRRRRMQHWLLFALRCMAFMLLVSAFVRPYFGSGQADADRGLRANVILFDNSFSLRYGNRFDQAKQRARAIIDETRGNEPTMLVTFGQNYESQNKFTKDTGQLKAALDSLKPGSDATDYVQALRGAEGLFKESAAADRRIFLISDFQGAGRNEAEASYRLPSNIKLVTIDVGEQNSPNLAIMDVGLEPMIYQAKYSNKLTGRIANFSDEEKTGVRVEFQLNDYPVAKREIKIAPRDAATVEFADFNLNEGVNRGVIVIDGDNFTFDNRYNFTLRRAEQMKALAIETATRGRSESFYLRNALTTGENLPFNLEIKSAGSVNPADLGAYRVIILNDAPVNQALAAGLIKFVEGGGGLVIATGPHTEPAAFNQVFQNFAPAKLEESVRLTGGRGADYVVMSEVKTDHPIFEVFKRSGRLATAHVFGYVRATPGEGAGVIARFEDGSPALIEATRGGGKLLLFTSTLDASWNDLPLTPIYLPLVRQMARHLGERDESASILVGETFTAAPDKDGTPPAVDSPNGERITDRKQTNTGELIVVAREPGFYRLRYTGNSDFAAVNLAGKESDLTRLDLNGFVTAMTGADPNTVAGKTAQERLSNEEIEGRQRVWWMLLAAALLLFITEAVLSRRMKMARAIN